MKNIFKIITLFAVLVVLVGGTATVSAQILKERNDQVKIKYQQAREQYQKEVNFYKNARQDFLNAKAKLQQSKNAENKKALDEAARNYLVKAVNSLIKRLEVIKNWISNRGALSESEKQSIIAEIDQDIDWLNEKLEKIDTASPEEIKEKAKIVREYWKNHRLKVKRVVGQIWAARINFVINKAENFSTKVDAEIQRIKATGKDTSQLEAWLNDFNKKLNLAKEKYEAAKAKFQAISDLTDADQLFREGHQFIIQANQYIKQAHVQLVQVVKEMKKIDRDKKRTEDGRNIENEYTETSTDR